MIAFAKQPPGPRNRIATEHLAAVEKQAQAPPTPAEQLTWEIQELLAGEAETVQFGPAWLPGEVRPRASARGKTFRTLKIADLFCGGGGFSFKITRLLDALGIPYELTAVNHWIRAGETIRLNHPDAKFWLVDLRAHLKDLHLLPADERAKLRDIHAADPEEIVGKGGYLDLLLASPSCTHHSKARGGKPTSDQQRMDPWVIFTWLTRVFVRRLICENVAEMMDWGPVDPETGKPIAKRKGEYYRAWIGALKGLGYTVETRLINSADYGSGTTRTRWFLIARRDRKQLIWPTPTHGKDPGLLSLFGPPLKPWRAARELIDWNDPGESIFGRPRPLKPNTIRRNRAGAVRFGGDWAPVFRDAIDLELTRSEIDAFWTKGLSLKEAAVWSGESVATLRGLIARRELRPMGSKKSKKPIRVRRCDLPEPRGDEARASHRLLKRLGAQRHDPGPLHYVTRRGKVVRVDESEAFGAGRSVISGIDDHELPLQDDASAFIFQVNQKTGRSRGFSSARDPLHTILTRDSLGLSRPRVRPQPFTWANRTDNAPRHVGDPIAPVLTRGAVFLTRWLIGQQSCATPRPLHQPAPTIAGAGAVGLWLAMAKRNSGARSVDGQIPTLTCVPHVGVGSIRVDPFVVSANHGTKAGDTHDRRVQSVLRPLGVLTTARGYGVAQPFVIPYYTGNLFHSGIAASTDVPLGVIPTRGRFGLVQPIARRTGEGWLVPFYGERHGQTARSHGLMHPLPTVVPGHGAGGVASPVIVLIDNASSAGVRSVDLPFFTFVGKANHAFADFIVCPRHSNPEWGPRPRTIEDPIPALNASGSQVALVSARAAEEDARVQNSGVAVVVDGLAFSVDVLFRMLRNPELADAMGFGRDYKFSGTGTEITKQIGNAVAAEVGGALCAAQLWDVFERYRRRIPEAPLPGEFAIATAA